MKCAKCGRELTAEGVFCQKCLATMARYPVKPGTVIQLPQRKAAAPKKPLFRKRLLTPEEQVIRQKKTIRWLAVMLACTVLLLCLSVALLFRLHSTQETPETIGQNYVTRDTRSR